jgi:HK97 family phage major capsid protein
MKKSVELRELKSQKVEELRSLINSDNFNTEEGKTNSENLKREIEDLNGQISNVEFLESQEKVEVVKNSDKRRNVVKPTEEQKFTESFSILRALNTAITGKPLQGAEAEAYEEAQREARSFGKDLSGNVGVPGFVMNRTATSPSQNVTADGDGGYGVFTDFAGHFGALRPRPVVEAAGATVIRGATSNLRFTKNSTVSVAWEGGENDANAEAVSTFSVLDLSPNRLGAFTDISKQLMLQSTPDVEAIVMEEIRRAIENAVDTAAINGAGTGGEPTGILNESIGVVAIGTNGGAVTWQHIVDLEKEVAIDNADFGRMAYITNPQVRGKLKTTEKATNTAQFIYTDSPVGEGQMPRGLMNGYNAMISTNVPSDLTKGTGTDLSAVIFGAFNALYIAQFGGLDIVVDPYTLSKNAVVTMVVNSWWDMGLRYPSHFAAIKDIDLTA